MLPMSGKRPASNVAMETVAERRLMYIIWLYFVVLCSFQELPDQERDWEMLATLHDCKEIWR